MGSPKNVQEFVSEVYCRFVHSQSDEQCSLVSSDSASDFGCFVRNLKVCSSHVFIITTPQMAKEPQKESLEVLEEDDEFEEFEDDWDPKDEDQTDEKQWEDDWDDEDVDDDFSKQLRSELEKLQQQQQQQQQPMKIN
jgi:26 proteasome complex subunit DSS1